MKTLLSLLLLFSVSTWASINTDCGKLSTCIEAVSKLTGDKYLYDRELEVRGATFVMGSSSNHQLTKDNADNLFSEMLSLARLARIRQGDGSYKIIQARDLQNSPLPIVESSFKQEPKLPDNNDFYQMNYTFTNIPDGYPIIQDAQSSIRGMLGREGRTFDLRKTNTIIVRDSAKNLKNFYTLLKQMDKKPSKERIEKEEERQKHRQEIELIEAKNCQSLKNELENMKKGQKN